MPFQLWDYEAAFRLTLIATTLATFIVAAHWCVWSYSIDRDHLREAVERVFRSEGATKINVLIYETITHFRKIVHGLAGKAAGWFIHQLYWYVNWLLTTNGLISLEASQSSIWRGIIVGGAEILIICSTVLVMAPYLHIYFRQRWAAVGLGLIGLVFVVGLLFGHPTIES